MRRKHIQLLVSSLVLLLATGIAQAQSYGKEQTMAAVRGAKVATGANLTVTDLKFLAWQETNPPMGSLYSDQAEYNLVSSDVLVRLKHEEDVVNVIENAFDIEVAFTLSRKLSDDTETITNETIRITYDPLENSIYKSEKLKRFVSGHADHRLIDANLYITGVTITSTTLTEVPKEVHLDLIIDQTRIYEMTVQPAPSLVVPSSANGSWIDLSWSAIEGAQSYDLEWVFVELPGTHYDFKNTNRINVTNNYARISKLLPVGNVVFRVRGVGMDPTEFAAGNQIRETTPWSTTAATGTVAQATSGSSPYGLVLSAFNTDLNWTAQTNYAEGGKSIETVQYFDGLGKSRQNLTSFRADGNVVVSESIYDLDGRESVSMMPVPMAGLDMSYKTNGSNFLYGDFGFLDFGTNDMLNPLVSATPSPMPQNSVYRTYYSANNPMNFEGKEYVPDAQDYAYTQKS